jgi:hypothetical protein
MAVGVRARPHGSEIRNKLTYKKHFQKENFVSEVHKFSFTKSFSNNPFYFNKIK